MLSVAELRSILRYDPETGRLSWSSVYKKSLIGAAAGSIGHRGYIKVQIQGRIYQSDRIIWAMQTGNVVPDDVIVDHKNGDRADNRWENLRLASASQNQGNTKPRNRPLPKGVSAFRRQGVHVGYRAYVGTRYLGVFSTVELAQRAYADAAASHFGEFARVS